VRVRYLICVRVTYKRHVVVPAAVSVGLQVSELVRVCLYDDPVSTSKLIVASRQVHVL